MMSETLDTWLDLATRLEAGDEVIITDTLPQGAAASIPARTIARVIENSLNEMQPTLILQARGDDGEICVFGPSHVVTEASEWHEVAIVQRVR
jgi:hypothetical protein